jgi:RimJ/RimL family protein N-acetyltransferase
MAINFNPLTEYILEDDAVLLMPLQEYDNEFLVDFAINEPDTWKYSYISAAGEEGMRAYVQSAMAARAAGREYPFIVFDKKNKAYAGCTRFCDIHPVYETLQLGYTWYGARFRGTGLNKRCKFLMLEFAFEVVGVQRVEFRADAANDRSIAAMKSIGCIVEGILRSNMPKSTGGRRDSIVLSILKNEWEADVKTTLKNKIAAI